MIIHRFTSAQLGTGQIALNRILMTCGTVFVAGALSGCSSDASRNDEVVIFAAASLQKPMQEVADGFQAEHGTAVRLNFASSGALAQQILAGAEADVFVSASKDWADEISSLGGVAKDSAVPLLSNSLVIVAHESTDWKLDSIKQLGALPFRYLVIGDPDFVPAGKYATQLLRSVRTPESETSLWDSLGERISPTSDLRRIIALVESDPSLIGMVYATDVLQSGRVRVICQVPRDRVSVGYFLVTMKSSSKAIKGRHDGNEFRQHVLSETAADIFRRYGFTFADRSN